MSNAVVQLGPIVKLKGDKTLIHGTLSGSFGKDDVSLFTEWAHGFHKAVKDAAANARGTVSAIVDITKLETYTDPKIITVLTKLVKDDMPFMHRTATFGGNALHELIQGVIRSLTSRQNIRNFKTEKEALEWAGE
jgi:hypothetical protein